MRTPSRYDSAQVERVMMRGDWSISGTSEPSIIRMSGGDILPPYIGRLALQSDQLDRVALLRREQRRTI